MQLSRQQRDWLSVTTLLRAQNCAPENQSNILSSSLPFYLCLSVAGQRTAMLHNWIYIFSFTFPHWKLIWQMISLGADNILRFFFFIWKLIKALENEIQFHAEKIKGIVLTKVSKHSLKRGVAKVAMTTFIWENKKLYQQSLAHPGRRAVIAFSSATGQSVHFCSLCFYTGLTLLKGLFKKNIDTIIKYVIQVM